MSDNFKQRPNIYEKSTALIIENTFATLGPNFLAVAHKDNVELYREAASVFYGHTIFNFAVTSTGLHTVNHFLKTVLKDFGNAKLIRHIVLLINRDGVWYDITTWLENVQSCLSPQCKIQLKGIRGAIEFFCRQARIALRLRKNGVDWPVIRDSMDDIHDLMRFSSCEYLLPKYIHNGYPMDEVDYVEEVVNRVEGSGPDVAASP